ncbi:UDP-N-acetylglucosamine 2-epimerase [Oceanospirillaceae bacterium]|nr:UDP-N-acetylglucosamine 2-epimerase [Oceanospirillaceae bacterium]
MRKICVVVTARPSYSRIKTTLQAIKSNLNLELQLVVAGSALLDRYGKVSELMIKDGFEITSRVFNVIEGEDLLSMAKTTGIGIVELSTVFDQLKPDVVVTIADRFETIATAIAASYMNIPLAHIQGGEVTGSIDEKVRHSITKLSDLHFVSNGKAAERVFKLGEVKATIFDCGCPSIDIAKEVLERPEMDFEPFEKYGGVGPGSELDLSGGYIIVMQHPVTTEYKDSGQQILHTLEAVQNINMPTLFFWPNVDAGSDALSKGIREYRELSDSKNIHYFRNMVSLDFLRLLANSKAIVGNSSVAIRECSFLGVPAVNIGSRQSGRERGGNVIDVMHDTTEIENAIRLQVSRGHFDHDLLYGKGDAGKQIADILEKVELTCEKKLIY